MKIIMPIATPATVSVTQVERDPIRGDGERGDQPAAAPAADVVSASASAGRGEVASLMRLQAEAEQALLQRYVGGERRHLAVMDDAAVVHHAHVIAELPRDMEILLDQQDGRAACA